MKKKDLSLVCSWMYTLLVCCSTVTGAMAVDALPKQILVFGGNGMIGSATVARLLSSSTSGPADDQDGHPGGGGDGQGRPTTGRTASDIGQLVLVHRGNWYWDSAFTIRPWVRHIKCDRQHGVDKCPELSAFVSSCPVIDLVIDFSAYHPHSMTQALQLLGSKVKQYIYISSDSVYEVCEKNHSKFTREEDAVRPEDKETQSDLIRNENYGHFKLQCEEVLAEYRQRHHGPPYLALRLPDVVGARDNTYRWWIYQLWIKLAAYLERPVAIPPDLTSAAMSLVYVNDVAELIVGLVKHTPAEALDQAFNLAMTETPTLLEMLNGMKDRLNLTDMEILQETRDDPIRLFPSVRLGPVDISKAQRILNWKPTAWSIALKETLEFYESAMKQVYIDKQKHDIIHTMQTYFTSKPYNIIRGLKDVYGMSYAEPKDEL